MVCPFWGMQRSDLCPKIAHPCFQLKCFAVLGGCNGAIYVPKSRILVFNLNGLPFWGDATLLFRGIACPKNTLSYFPKKGFAVLGGCNRRFWPKMAQKRENIHADVPFLDILVFNLNVLLFQGDATLCAFS